MPVFVDVDKCDGCESCMDVCPTESITILDGVAHVDPEECIDCEACVDECPNDALCMVEEGQASNQ
jgi:ferredoxin